MLTLLESWFYFQINFYWIHSVAIFEHIPAVTEASREYYEQSSNKSSKALGIEFEVQHIKSTFLQNDAEDRYKNGKCKTLKNSIFFPVDSNHSKSDEFQSGLLYASQHREGEVG